MKILTMDRTDSDGFDDWDEANEELDAEEEVLVDDDDVDDDDERNE